MNRLSVWRKKIARKGKGRGERACRQTFEAAIPPSCNYLAEHLSVRSLSVNQFRAWVTPGKINGKWAVFCSVSKQSEMDREPNCRFCKKSLISGKRINTVPIFGVSRNKTLLVDSGQDSVVLAQAFDSSRFPFVLFPLPSSPLDQRPVHRLCLFELFVAVLCSAPPAFAL